MIAAPAAIPGPREGGRLFLNPNFQTEEGSMDSPVKGSVRRIIETAGNGTCLLLLAIMGITCYEVVSRYLFNAPTTWAWLINRQLFGVYMLAGGAYALVQGSHIRIEILHDRFPAPARAMVRCLTLLASCIFLCALIWKGSVMGLEALRSGERATGTFPLPLYPLKLCIPVGALLFLLGCLRAYGTADAPRGSVAEEREGENARAEGCQ